MENSDFDFFDSRWFKTIVAFVIIFILALIAKGMFLDFIDSYEKGYKFDKRTGKLTIIERTGWIVTPPFVVSVNSVDIRPVQVCINANARVLNCKLVQFNPDGLELFLSWHGRKDYTIGTSETTGSFTDILRSYAYSGSGETYPFLTILKELKPSSDTLEIQGAAMPPTLIDTTTIDTTK